MSDIVRTPVDSGKAVKSFTFKVPAGRNLAACVGEGSLRYKDNCPVICKAKDEKVALVMATDGRTASVVEVEGEFPEKPMPLPAAALKAHGRDVKVTVNGEVRCEAHGKTTVHQLPDASGRFPALVQVFEDVLQSSREYVVLRLDTRLLANLAIAISGTNSLTLLVPMPAKDSEIVQYVVPVIGAAHDSEGDPAKAGVGLIMPMAGEREGEARVSTYLSILRAMVGQLPSGKLYFDPLPENQPDEVKPAETK